jgi:hypothetical protein
MWLSRLIIVASSAWLWLARVCFCARVSSHEFAFLLKEKLTLVTEPHQKNHNGNSRYTRSQQHIARIYHMQSVSQRMTMWLSAALLLLGTSLPHVVGEGNSYGADRSWPIHHAWTNTSKPLTNERKAAHEHFMDGCRKQNVENAARDCDGNERYRLQLSLDQPQSMVNFTSTGFKKVRAPESLRKLLAEHWERNKDVHFDEAWESTDVYANHWEDEPYLVTLDDENENLRTQIWDYAKDVIERWTGMELRRISLYGIRVYTNGKLLYRLHNYRRSA